MSVPIDPKEHTFRSAKFEGVVKETIVFLVESPVFPLPPERAFVGVGLYALYYAGNHELYDFIAKQNRGVYTMPIYVGKAVPPGWRTSRTSELERTRALYGRLRQHARSIQQGRGLEIGDFSCRFMILEGVDIDLISSVEAQLIRRYKPLWNTVVDGFGNHDPGKGRYNQARSEWDVLHPGRPWAERLTGVSPRKQNVIAKIKVVRESVGD